MSTAAFTTIGPEPSTHIVQKVGIAAKTTIAAIAGNAREIQVASAYPTKTDRTTIAATAATMTPRGMAGWADPASGPWPGLMPKAPTGYREAKMSTAR